MAHKRLGELLLERGVISPSQLEEGLAHHRQTRQRLGVALIQKGFVTEEGLARVLGEALGLPVVDLRSAPVEWSAVHLLRARFCETHELFPYALEPGRGGRKQVIVAMSDPLNLAAIEEIEFTTGLKVVPRLAPLSQVRAAILRYFHKVHSVDEGPAGTMTVVSRGGGVRTVPVEPSGESEDEEIIVGEEVSPAEITARTALTDVIASREAQRLERRGRGSPTEEAARDLDFLFGLRDDGDAVEGLERKFWALMRIMARKGLITQAEFQQELDEERKG